ncbi:Nif3-like dinuclear metal center hexameric protein [Macrococcus equipercicus]|uniref:GTP cyclohydrolase 1 type 2 homolog n=1 Tax=Macrococcus equipercicus TaxID=69967 RepID=A0A9Q9BU74_9STAP|nr:Nif3-like dinuclear metal center hexameric protein [Macrococcus equipercicus]UTH12968.1 Nif3-like dinuclear metal center hexameric protein [Macrococcus equipercicus]
MKINELMQLIDREIPLSKAESWDNVGLLIGDKESAITTIMTTLDCTLEVVEEAVQQQCNTIICHHPLIFSGIKNITNQGYGAVIQQLIKNSINLIALHTNLDAHPQGVSAMIADKLDLINQDILVPQLSAMAKLQLFVPESHVMQVKAALSEAGAGQIGDYSDCFFQLEGTGQFKPDASAHPYTGEVGKLEIVDEIKLECVFEPRLRRQVEAALIASHPYEEPAYDIYEFLVKDMFGTGIKAELEQPVQIGNWLKEVKSKLKVDTVRLIGSPDQEIRTVGIIGGAGMDYVPAVRQSGVDVFLTGDIKYHEAHDLLMNGLPAVDIQHYAESVVKEGLKSLLESFDLDVPVISSTVDTNPFKAY